jgi:hypothetical protein
MQSHRGGFLDELSDLLVGRVGCFCEVPCASLGVILERAGKRAVRFATLLVAG